MAIVCRYSGCTLAGDDDLAVALRAADGHQHGLGRRAAAVVEAGVRDIEAGEPRDERLVLEHDLQIALADLGLVRRVGRVELAAAGDLIDDGRDEVVVAAAAEEADLCSRRARSSPRARSCAA